MTEPVSFRQALPLDPLGILQRAPSIGRALVGVRAAGALLERVGTLDPVIEEDGFAISRGDGRETRLQIGAVAAIVCDRSETPHDTILPYVDFLGRDGESLLKVTGLDGIGKFDEALAGLDRRPLPYLAPPDRPAIPVTSEDPGAKPLQAALASGAEVTLRAERAGISQSWSGAIRSLSFGHNYINVIQSDVHLHVRGKAIAEWRETAADDVQTWVAIAESGAALGLTLSTRVGALENAKAA